MTDKEKATKDIFFEVLSVINFYQPVMAAIVGKKVLSIDHYPRDLFIVACSATLQATFWLVRRSVAPLVSPPVRHIIV